MCICVVISQLLSNILWAFSHQLSYTHIAVLSSCPMAAFPAAMGKSRGNSVHFPWSMFLFSYNKIKGTQENCKNSQRLLSWNTHNILFVSLNVVGQSFLNFQGLLKIFQHNTMKFQGVETNFKFDFRVPENGGQTFPSRLILENKPSIGDKGWKMIFRLIQRLMKKKFRDCQKERFFNEDIKSPQNG
jgi:hypothetical protein